jgi:hypothetical protein
VLPVQGARDNARETERRTNPRVLRDLPTASIGRDDAATTIREERGMALSTTSLKLKTKAPDRILFKEPVVFGPSGQIPKNRVLQLRDGSQWPAEVLERIADGRIQRLGPDDHVDVRLTIDIVGDSNFREWFTPSQVDDPPQPIFLTKAELLRALRWTPADWQRWSTDDWDDDLHRQHPLAFPSPKRQHIPPAAWGGTDLLWSDSDVQGWLDRVRALATSLQHAKL